MKNIETRKLIAIFITLAYVVFVGYCLVEGVKMVEGFNVIAASVISYYFAKSTALEKPIE